jgi:hypothetical protein
MGFSRKGHPAPLKDAGPSPCDRLMARRRTVFVRDWILVLIALGLATAAGAFHGDPSNSQDTPMAASAAAVR